MIYDCFTFMDELELLDLKLRVLSPVVDHFVLVEATTTFTGKPKELIFAANRDRFAKYADKIIYVAVTDSPKPTSPTDVWNVEAHQRNAIMRGLTDAPRDSRIIISDADEIAHPEVVTEYSASNRLVGFPCRLYYYYVNCLQTQLWHGPVMSPRCSMPTPHKMRFSRTVCPVNANKLGWHFSFLGGVDRVRAKLAAFSETQVNTKATTNSEHIQHCLETGEDLFFRKDAFARKEFVPIDDTYPACIHDWIAEYPYLMKTQLCQISTSS